VILLLAGLVYAWSVLSSPIALEFPQWTKAQLSLTFTLVMAMFCVGCLAGGMVSAKIDPRVLCIASGGLFLIGFYLSARIQTLPMLYLSFGVLCGLASGMVYNTVMSTICKRFADRQGLISGILLMGFGIGSFIIGKIYQICTPEIIGAWRRSFLWLGIVAFAVLTVCAPFLSRPKTMPPARAVGRKIVKDVPASAMIRMPVFWMYYLWAILLSVAGLALVSQAAGIAREVGTHVSVGTITTVVGLISVCNGAGRVIFGGMFDRLGRQAVMMLANLLFLAAASLLIAALLSRSFPVLTAGFIVGGLAYGGVTPTNSAFIGAYFGQAYYPVNFSIINTNLLIASAGSTIAGALYDASQSYLSTHLLIIASAAAGVAATYGILFFDRKAGRE
jgi:OFA family oxalate/formate antiporter-like MFS transporter